MFYFPYYSLSFFFRSQVMGAQWNMKPPPRRAKTHSLQVGPPLALLRLSLRRQLTPTRKRLPQALQSEVHPELVARVAVTSALATCRNNDKEGVSLEL